MSFHMKCFRGVTRKYVTSSEHLQGNTNKNSFPFPPFFFLLFLAVTEIAAVDSALTPSWLNSCSEAERQRWRLRYGDSGWVEGRRERQRQFVFLYDAFSPWGQGATVIQTYRGAVQKPPPIHMHGGESAMMPGTLRETQNMTILTAERTTGNTASSPHFDWGNGAETISEFMTIWSFDCFYSFESVILTKTLPTWTLRGWLITFKQSSSYGAWDQSDDGVLRLFVWGGAQCDTGSEAYFGKGTKLTVLGKSELWFNSL